MNKSTEKLHPLTTALAAARHRAGLSQRALADKVGLAQSHISKIERGAVDPQASSLIEVARVLGLELSLVPTQLVPALGALIRETVPNPRELPSSLDHELTRLARRARALMKHLPGLKVLPGIALTADELRVARLDEPAYAEARSSIAASSFAGSVDDRGGPPGRGATRCDQTDLAENPQLLDSSRYPLVPIPCLSIGRHRCITSPSSKSCSTVNRLAP
jgi:transcriptional regulator with XRE-family HTH domain